MIPLDVIKISYHPSNKSYAVILKEVGGERYLPIVIGAFEAQSIALAIEVIDPPRPLTHDLLCDIISGIKAKLKEVRINHLQEGIFYSQIEISSENFESLLIDSRPSDAIAMALRLNAPIMVTPDIFDEASILEEYLVEDNHQKEDKINISLDTLRAKLRNAIAKEEYETAAKLRDTISRLEP